MGKSEVEKEIENCCIGCIIDKQSNNYCFMVHEKKYLLLSALQTCAHGCSWEKNGKYDLIEVFICLFVNKF